MTVGKAPAARSLLTRAVRETLLRPDIRNCQLRLDHVEREAPLRFDEHGLRAGISKRGESVALHSP
jgi:hypothetical protein